MKISCGMSLIHIGSSHQESDLPPYSWSFYFRGRRIFQIRYAEIEDWWMYETIRFIIQVLMENCWHM